MEQENKPVPENREEQKIIRQYLLGNLADREKMREIEENLLADDEFAEKLTEAEEMLLEDYLDGQLADSDKGRFTEFFLAAPERRQKLRLTRNLRKYAAGAKTVKEAPEKKIGFWEWLFLPSTVRFAAVALLLLGSAFGVWRVFFYRSNIDKGLAQLRLAYSGQRTIQSRTTAGFNYAPFMATRGAGDGVAPAADEKARARAELLLSEATSDSRGAEAHHALGLLYLTEKRIDPALKEFNLALGLAPNDAKLHSDTGAAYLEKAVLAQSAGKGDEFLENADLSLKHLNTALELDENLLDALFNKALILQKMPPTRQAREAWEKYLEKDSVSPWADEARKNLEILKQESGVSKGKSQILLDYLDAYSNREETEAWRIASQTKELITGVMLAPQLAEGFLKADRQNQNDETGRLLRAFAHLGKLEKQFAQDLFFEELADYYSKTDKTQRQSLLEAQSAMQNGYQLILRSDWKTALETFQQAKNIFSGAGNTWEAQIAEYQISYALCQLKQIKESNERLVALSNLAEMKKYRWLQSLADGWIANNYSLLKEESKAINYGQKSLKTAQEISDTYNIQKVFNQLAHQYWLIGDVQKTLVNIYSSLNFSNLYYLSPRQKSRNLLIAVGGLYRFKFYDAASVFAHEQINVAQNELNDIWLRHTTHNQLAAIYAESKKYSRAFQEIESAFRLADSFPDETMRRRQATATRLVQANIQKESGNCREAVENYDQVIQDYENTEFSINKYRARKGRLLCFAELEDDSAFKAEMPLILKMFDENRRTIAEESDRITFFDNEQGLYDIAVEYAYTRLKDNELAFNYTENSRSRALLSLLQSEEAQPLSLTEIRAKLPPGIQIIYYAVLDDRLLIWQISDTKFITIEKPIAADELDHKVKDYLRLIIRREDARASAKELHELLIEPVESSLEKDKILCVVADKSLLRLPFAALVSPETNKYLIEDHTLLYAPSATVFLIETEIARQKAPTQNETILSIGNPRFSRTEYPNLADLPSAAREAEKIAGFYSSPKVFSAEKAGKEQIIDNLNESDVFHFAGHYVPNNASPLHSKLVLAAGDLTVEEIKRQQLQRPRLVVLSACETAIEGFYKGEGAIGAARAFLASSVPLVLSSQWAVDSETTADLMIKFHYYRKQNGMNTTKALRAAQMDILAADDQSPFRQPYYWAAFLPIGGYTDY